MAESEATDHGPIRMWIVEDDTEYRAGLTRLIERTAGLQLARAFPTAEAVLRELEWSKDERGPEVVLMDVNLPGMNGLDCLVRVKARFPEAAIVMLTIRDDRDTIFGALCSGASGYIPKNCPVDELIAAIQQAHRGGMLMPAAVAKKVMAQLSRPTAAEYGLSSREKDVLAGMVEGLSQKEVANALGISVATVNVHVQHIYAKLHVNSSSTAVAKAIRERLV